MIVALGNGVSLRVNTGFGSSNCLFIEGERPVLVETGGGKALADIEPESVALIVNTHRHIDHVKGNGRFPRATVCAHAREKGVMDDVALSVASSGWDRFMDGCYEDYLADLPVQPQGLHDCRPVHETLSDGDVIDCGHTRMEVLHTPGHTSGHCSLFLPEEEILFSGDICLTAVGPCYADPDADIDDFLTSLDRLIAIKPKTLVTSHSRKVYNGSSVSVLSEFKSRIFQREERVLAALQDHPMTIHALAKMKIIYAHHPSIFVLFWEKCMLEKHLMRLKRAGYAMVSDEGLWSAV